MSSISDPQRAVLAIAGHLGALVHDERVRRSWTLRELAGRAGVSVGMAHRVEAGGPASLETYVRLASALALRPSFELVDTRRRVSTARLEDPVHAAMGEVLAGRLASAGFEVALDEPYQHFQFAGRADVLAWSIGAEALLHIENRTRFPNQQEAFGSYNAKRRYLPAVMAQRLGLRRGWQAVSHAMVALWSAEALHAIRIRTASFRAVCPDPMVDVENWLKGMPPPPRRPTSTLLILDPVPGRRSGRPDHVGLDEALRVRPRYRGYAEAVAALSL